MTERNTCNFHLVALTNTDVHSCIQLVPVQKCPERDYTILVLLFYGIHVCLKSEEKKCIFGIKNGGHLEIQGGQHLLAWILMSNMYFITAALFSHRHIPTRTAWHRLWHWIYL